MAMSGRKVDETLRWHEGVLYPATKAPEVEELGTMHMPTGKEGDWSSTLRAWGQEPEPTIEQRLAALEERD